MDLSISRRKTWALQDGGAIEKTMCNDMFWLSF